MDERFIKPGLSPVQRGVIGAALLFMGVVVGIVATLVASHWHSSSARPDARVADLEGVWQITYADGSDRIYRIQSNGTVTERWREGRVRMVGDRFVLTFDADGERERLTLGNDGRLFVESDDAMPFRAGKVAVTGIGVRE